MNGTSDGNASTDDQIRESVWGGNLPVMFTLAKNDVLTLNPPAPIFVLAPRCSYLPLVAQTAKERLARFAPTGFTMDEVWFEAPGSIPLKW